MGGELCFLVNIAVSFSHSLVLGITKSHGFENLSLSLRDHLVVLITLYKKGLCCKKKSLLFLENLKLECPH